MFVEGTAVVGTAVEGTTVVGTAVEGTTVEAETAEVAHVEAAMTTVEVAETAEAGMVFEAVVVGPATVEARVAGLAIMVGPATMEAGEATGGKAAKGGAELGSGSSSSFSYEDSEEVSEETVLEMRSEVGLDEAGPTVEPEARPVDPLIAQFGGDDGLW